MKIITYASSIKLPPTIFTRKTLLQNTQTRLSYTHVYFTNDMDVDADCDILAMYMDSLNEESLKAVEKRYSKTIIWSDDAVNTVLWFLETFDRNPHKCYVVVNNKNNMNVSERDVIGVAQEKYMKETVPESNTNNAIEEYLDHNFNELRKKNASVERIFSRLSLMKDQKP